MASEVFINSFLCTQYKTSLLLREVPNNKIKKETNDHSYFHILCRNKCRAITINKSYLVELSYICTKYEKTYLEKKFHILCRNKRRTITIKKSYLGELSYICTKYEKTYNRKEGRSNVRI